MQIFVLALSRLVPLSLLISLTLVGSRYVHDLVLRTNPARARLAFAAVSLIGLLSIAPYAWRAGLIVTAQWATGTQRWKAADLMFTEYDSWNGRRSEDTLRMWAYARMNLNDWNGAIDVLALADAPSPQEMVLMGVCQYYAGSAAAEQTLRSIPDVTSTQLCVRDYLLGRIAQKRGDSARAFALYARSAAWEPNFFPSTYHGVRLRLASGDRVRAGAILDAFVRRFPALATDAEVGRLREAVRTGSVPPDKEFVIVSN